MRIRTWLSRSAEKTSVWRNSNMPTRCVRLCAMGLVAAAVLAAAPAHGFDLVRQGEPAAVIVVPDNPVSRSFPSIRKTTDDTA